MEEALAEGFATRSVLTGLKYPIKNMKNYKLKGNKILAEATGYVGSIYLGGQGLQELLGYE